MSLLPRVGVVLASSIFIFFLLNYLRFPTHLNMAFIIFSIGVFTLSLCYYFVKVKMFLEASSIILMISSLAYASIYAFAGLMKVITSIITIGIITTTCIYIIRAKAKKKSLK